MSSWEVFLLIAPQSWSQLAQLCGVGDLSSYPVSGQPRAGLIAVFLQQGRTRFKGLFLFPGVSAHIKKYLKVCKYS